MTIDHATRRPEAPLTRADVLAKPEARLGRVLNLPSVVDRFGPEPIAAMLDGFVSSDTLADDALESLSVLPGAERHRIMKQAIDGGIDSVPDAPEALRALFAQLDDVPDWVDWDQIHRGAVSLWRPGDIVPFTFLTALGEGYQTPHVARVVTFTGLLQGYDDAAYRRLKETQRWFAAALRPGGLRRDADGFALTVHVRIVHAMVRRALADHPDWDPEQWGTPICNTDLQYGVLYQFGPSVIRSLHKLGFRPSRQERDDMHALFRYMGHLIGLPDHLNPATEHEGHQLRQAFVALSAGPDPTSKELANGLLTMAVSPGTGYEELPRPLRTLFSPRRLQGLVNGLSHFFIGTEGATNLEIPSSRWRYLPYALRPAVLLRERIRSIVGFDDEAACLRTLARLRASCGDVQTVADPESVAAATQANRSKVNKRIRDGGLISRPRS